MHAMSDGGATFTSALQEKTITVAVRPHSFRYTVIAKNISTSFFGKVMLAILV